MVFHLAFFVRMKIILTSLTLVFFIEAGICQQHWTYQECAKYAIEHNLELNNTYLLVEQQKAYSRNAKNSLLPNIGAGIDYNLSQGRSVDPNTNTYVENRFFQNNYGISGTMNLFGGFQKQNRIAFEKYNLASEEEAYKMRENDLNYQVLEAYINLLVDQGLIEIIEEQYQISQRELERISKFIELGRVSGTERYDVEARLANDEFLLLKQKNQAELSALQLKKLMNIHADSTILVEDIDLFEQIDFEISADSLFQYAKKHLPRIKTLTNKLEAAEKQVAMARSNLYPTLDLNAQYGTGLSDNFLDQNAEVIPYGEQFKNNQSIRYGLSLQIPIFYAFSRRNQIQLSKIAKEQATNNYRIGLQNLEYEVSQVKLEWNAAVSEYLSAVKKEQSEEKALEVAVKKREKGLISVMEFYEARNNLAVAKAEILRTRLQAFLKERTLTFYLTGNLLE